MSVFDKNMNWFPILLGLVQVARFILLFLYDASELRIPINLYEYVRDDLSRPFFEVFNFCGGYISYTAGEQISQALDLPASVLASLSYSLALGEMTCINALETVRGKIFMIPFISLFGTWLGKVCIE